MEIILVLTYKCSKTLDGLFKILLNFVWNVMKQMAGNYVTSTMMVLTCVFVIEQKVVGVKILNICKLIVLMAKFSSDSINIGVSVMMIVTIEVIYGRLMTKLVVVFLMLSIIYGITLVKKNIKNIMILVTICTQEMVAIHKNNAIT